MHSIAITNVLTNTSGRCFNWSDTIIFYPNTSVACTLTSCICCSLPFCSRTRTRFSTTIHSQFWMRACSCASPSRLVFSCSIFHFSNKSQPLDQSRLQFSVKVYSVKYSDNITWMINYLYEIYKTNAATNCGRRASLFNRFAFYTEIVFMCGILLYFLSMVSYFLYPIYMYLFDGEIVTLIPTYFPGINEKSYSGFIILSCYQILLIFLAFIAASACDFLFTMLIVNVPVMAILIEMEVEQLNDILTSQKVDEPLAKSKFRNILLMHREMTEYVNFGFFN